ncbi:MAG: DUF3721 domain-containing protein [Cyanobium sp.]
MPHSLKPATWRVAFTWALLSLAASAWAQQGGNGGVPAVYATRAEAEKAARQFHCSGAHRMGDHWMPCASHGEVPGAAPDGAAKPGGSR